MAQRPKMAQRPIHKKGCEGVCKWKKRVCIHQTRKNNRNNYFKNLVIKISEIPISELTEKNKIDFLNVVRAGFSLRSIEEKGVFFYAFMRQYYKAANNYEATLRLPLVQKLRKHNILLPLIVPSGIVPFWFCDREIPDSGIVAKISVMKKWCYSVIKNSVILLALKKYRKTLLSILPRDIVHVLCQTLIHASWVSLKVKCEIKNVERRKHVLGFVKNIAGKYSNPEDREMELSNKCICYHSYDQGVFICKCQMEEWYCL